MRLGVDVHLVEIDPMVYQYAKEFFGLLPNHTAHITDAVQFVKKEAAVEKPTQYQYIIHDVFTGGAAPSSLLTTDMMEDMKKLMVDDGVIAIVSYLHSVGDLLRRGHTEVNRMLIMMCVCLNRRIELCWRFEA